MREISSAEAKTAKERRKKSVMKLFLVQKYIIEFGVQCFPTAAACRSLSLVEEHINAIITQFARNCIIHNNSLIA